MKKIETTTSQNVTIEYLLATIMERALALFLDLVVMWSIIGFVMILVTGILSIQSPLTFYFVAAPIFFFYTLVSEIFFNGQSLGKRWLKLRVIKLTGSHIQFTDYLMRWVFRLIDIYSSVGAIGILAISSSPKSQRLGDFFADTAVIKISLSNRLSFDHIMKMEKLMEYEPTYTEIARFSDEDMLVIKETVERYRKYPNQGHEQALNLLLQTIKEKLDIEPGKNKIAFLQTLIKDYVVLTR